MSVRERCTRVESPWSNRMRICLVGLLGMSAAVGAGWEHPLESPRTPDLWARDNLVAWAAAESQKIATANAILTLKSDSGDLIGAQWKQPKLDIITEGKLGENFRILLPLPNYEANYFNSRDQVVRKIERTSTGVVLHYGPLKNEREQVDVNVSYEIRDTGTQLEFSIQVDNQTDRKLAEVFYGIIGGQQGIGNRLDTESFIAAEPYGNAAPGIFRQFQERGVGWWHWGSPVTSASYSYPGSMAMGWIDVFNPKIGVAYYYANQDPETRMTALYTEMTPYIKRLSPQDNWPQAGEVPAGEPIGVKMGWVNFPYAGAGVFRAGPVALQVHTGDWRTAAKLYRGWYDQHFKVARPLNWLRKEMAWYSVMLLAPDDKVYWRFKDLPKLAAEAKKYGVTTTLIFGWSKGGQTRGYPDYSPDPRLGTREEFRKALTDMKAMGVHPLLFAHIQHVDSSTEAFQTQYSKYAVQGRWAPDWLKWTWRYSTIGGSVTSALDRHLVTLSPSHPAFRQELIRQYVSLIEDGAEGLHFDAANLGTRTLDFNPSVPTSPDKSMSQGLQATYEEFLSAARKINPDVAIASQDGFDRNFPYNDGWAHAIHEKDVIQATRYAFPEFNIMDEEVDVGDFTQMNNVLRYGAVWGPSPRGCTGSMDEELARPLSRYLSELIRIRKQYADLLFFGRFNDTEGAQVTGDQENIRYSVFTPVNAEDPRRAIVVVNFGGRNENADVVIPGKAGQKVTISAPFETDRTAVLPAKLTLPAHRAAVVVTQ